MKKLTRTQLAKFNYYGHVKLKSSALAEAVAIAARILWPESIVKVWRSDDATGKVSYIVEKA